MGTLDLPSEPEEAGRAERSGKSGADRPITHEMPDPEERGRVYEAMRGNDQAETGNEAEPGRCPDGIDTRSYWEEAPRLLDMWADHEKRWPPRSPAPVDHSDDPPGVDAATAEAAHRVSEAEPGISAAAQVIEQENDHGGWLEGFEFRRKGDDRLKEKIAEQMEAEPGKSLDQIMHKIPDAIRLTFCFRPDSYVQGYYDIKERLESSGYDMYYSKNWWTDPEYKGINTRWVAPGDQRFEVQFHTPESFHAKHYVTHAAYERIRDLTTSRSERRELHAFQQEVSSRIRIPDGAADIPDFTKEGF